MLTQIVRDLRLNRGTLWAYGLGMLGAFAVGSGIVAMIVGLGGEETWICLGTVMAMGTAFAVVCIGSAATYGMEFRLYLSMGGTRKAFLLSYAVRLLLTVAGCYLLVRLLYIGENALFTLAFPGRVNEMPLTFLASPWCLPVLLGVCVVAMFLGSLRARFGNKGLTVFWILWLAGCVILPRLSSEEDGPLTTAANTMLAALLAVPPTVWAAFFTISALGMIAAILYWGMRQDV